MSCRPRSFQHCHLFSSFKHTGNLWGGCRLTSLGGKQDTLGGIIGKIGKANQETAGKKRLLGEENLKENMWMLLSTE